MPASDHPVLAHTRLIRQRMLQRDKELLNRLVRDYLKAFRNLETEIRTLEEAVKGENPLRGDLARLAALQNLLEGVRREIQKYAAILADEILAASRIEIEAAGLDALNLVQASLPGMDPAMLVGGWGLISPEYIYTMFGFLDPDGPLYAAIRQQFGQAVADLVRDTLMQGYIQGRHPNQIGRLIHQAAGTGLDWALNTARTSNLWAYRAATHAYYLNNSQLVKGWIWHAALDQRVCMSCVAQHGTEHPLTEVLADHHRGRCTPIPITKTYAELGIKGVSDNPVQIERGEDWFKKQPAAVQRKMMGPAKWRAWQDGAFTFDQLSRPYIDPVYGRMMREASLKEILGEKANLYYGK